MATMLGSLLISLGLESGQFKSGMNEAERQLVKTQKAFERSGRAMQELGAKMTLGITAPLVAFGGFAVKAASDAAELQSAFDQTFGALSKDMTAWAEATGDAMGRSTQEIQQAANTFGIFFNQAAPTKQAAADLSKQFAVLAQDLSSFFNTDPTEALQKLRSGLAGESEPLRDFGVFLNEAAVQAKAFELGIAAVGSKLTDQQKIMARAALIMEATAVAQGDVARTADGTANRVRAAKAAFEELQVAIGEKLIPAITPLISAVTNVLQAFSSLPDGVQTAIIVIAGFAAAAGPAIIVLGSLKIALATLATFSFPAAGAAAVGATAGVTGLRGAMLGLAAAMGPLGIALAAIAAVAVVVAMNHESAAEKTERFASAANEAEAKAAQLEKRLADAGYATEAMGRGMDATSGKVDGLNSAMGRAITTAFKLAQALNLVGLMEIGAAKLENQRERERIERGKSTTNVKRGRAGLVLEGKARHKDADAQLAELARSDAALDRQSDALITAMENGLDISGAPAEPAAASSSGGSDKKKTKKGPKGSTGPSAAEIEQRFQDELAGYAQQALGAMRQLATSAEERAELELRGIEIARLRTEASIEADEDYTELQKGRLLKQVEDLAEFERQVVERQKQTELEREATEMAGVRFDEAREMLRLDLEMADTQAERKQLALEILRLEQEYRRNQLEMVLASKTASDAEKARASAILTSLAAIEGKEAAAAGRQNETEVERYMRGLRLSADQVNEAIDGIRIDALDALNQGLVDAITGVKSLGAVFKNIANQIVADLLRIAIRKAIIAPIADALFSGASLFGRGGSTSSGFGPILNTSSGRASVPTIPFGGFRAAGGPVLAGRSYIVGENGPELFAPGGSGQIVSNRDLRGMSGSQRLVIEDTTGLFKWRVDQQIGEATPGIASVGATVAHRKLAKRSSRRVGG